MAEDRIVINDLLVRGVIGVNDWERESKQDVLVNITLFTDLTRAGRSDDVADSVNYRTITKQVIALVESAERLTLEALATDIARICLRLSSAPLAAGVPPTAGVPPAAGALRVRVRVEKPGALRFARSAGVEIEREASDFA